MSVNQPSYPRDLIGYGETPPDDEWPAGAVANAPLTGENERFIFVLDGQVELSAEGRANELDEEGHAFVRADQDRRITAQTAARLAVLERPCAPLAGQSAPRLHIANCKELTAAPMKDGDMPMQKSCCLKNWPLTVK